MGVIDIFNADNKIYHFKKTMMFVKDDYKIFIIIINILFMITKY